MEDKLPAPLSATTEITVIAGDGSTLRMDEATNHEGRHWRDLYRAAMAESDPEKVIDRITTALAAMVKQQMELEKNRFATLHERWEISDAMSSLESWRELNNKRNSE